MTVVGHLPAPGCKPSSAFPVLPSPKSQDRIHDLISTRSPFSDYGLTDLEHVPSSEIPADRNAHPRDNLAGLERPRKCHRTCHSQLTKLTSLETGSHRSAYSNLGSEKDPGLNWTFSPPPTLLRNLLMVLRQPLRFHFDLRLPSVG
jgi:hypothetical protein